MPSSGPGSPPARSTPRPSVTERCPCAGEVYADEGLRRLVRRGRALAAPRRPHTVHVEADGLAPDMPVAVIENAARPEMRVLRGLLAGLPELVEREAVKSPALIVIGEVTAREDAAVAALAQERVQ